MAKRLWVKKTVYEKLDESAKKKGLSVQKLVSGLVATAKEVKAQ